MTDITTRRPSAGTGRNPAATRLTLLAGGVAASTMVGTGVALRDASALVVGLALGAALMSLWLCPRGIAPALAALALLANVAYFTGTAVLSNARHSAGTSAIFLPSVIAASSLIASVAATIVLASPGPVARSSLSPRTGLRGGVLTGVVILVVLALAPGLHASGARPGDIVVRMRTTAYSPRQLHIPAAEAQVFVANGDLFWHTFTIDSLHLDLTVPVGGARRARLRVPPGRYEYYCRVPGHREAGMTGTLVVS